MASTQLFVGQIPGTAAARQALRGRAIDVDAALGQAHQPASSVALLNFDPGDARLAPVDMLLIRPGALLVGVLWRHDGPIDVDPGGPWRDRASGTALAGADGRSPLELARAQRDAVMERLVAARAVPGDARMAGAVVCLPAVHPESQISLDVDDHLRGLKVLGMDELAGVAAMISSGVALAERQMRALAEEVFGGRLWLDDGQELFELAPPRFALRALGGARAGELALLPEGETVVGRRRTPRRYERRVAIPGDDLISSDHAVLAYGDGEALTVRDTSKNGTWVAAPGEAEQHLRGSERAVTPGAVLRLGVTRMRVEQVR